MIAGTFPRPAPGLVVRYSYLWHAEHLEGKEEGVKDRPCAIVLALMQGEDENVVVLPITHSLPSKETLAVEIPISTKQRLGMDSERSWVLLTEANLFTWPGPDLRPAVNGDLSTIVYGYLPYGLFQRIRGSFLEALRKRRIRMVPRSQ